MAPADLRKEGSAHDLTFALGILAGSLKLKPKGFQIIYLWETFRGS